MKKKNKSSLKTRMILTFVMGTIIANIFIAIAGVGMAHYQIQLIKASDMEGEAMVPSLQIMALRMIMIIIIILVLTGISFYSSIYKDIVSPLKQLSEASKRIANGDLDFQIEDNGYVGEITDLCIDFEDMRRRLKISAEEKIQNEELNRQLISNINHDLKTPVTAIKGYAEGLIDGVADTKEKQEKYLRTIHNKAGDLERLLNELTYYTHIDQSRIPYNFVKVEVNNYFEDCIEDIKEDLDNVNFSLSYKNDIPYGTMIIADPVQLRKVINNIVGNSVKYKDKEIGRLNFHVKDTDEFILIEIADNGPGIPSKDIPLIFDRFFRSDKSRSSSTGGSGIGLSIVKKIIDDHGGRIWATSTLGEGTCMHIELRKYVENNE